MAEPAKELVDDAVTIALLTERVTEPVARVAVPEVLDEANVTRDADADESMALEDLVDVAEVNEEVTRVLIAETALDETVDLESVPVTDEEASVTAAVLARERLAVEVDTRELVDANKVADSVDLTSVVELAATEFASGVVMFMELPLAYTLIFPEAPPHLSVEPAPGQVVAQSLSGYIMAGSCVPQ